MTEEPRGRFALPTLPEVKDWRPGRVTLYWFLGWLTYMTLWVTLKTEGVKALFWYFTPKP